MSLQWIHPMHTLMCLPIHKWTFHMDMFSLTHICKHTTCTHLPVCLYTHMRHVCPYRLCDRHTVISNTMDWCEKRKKYFHSDVNTTCCESLALALPSDHLCETQPAVLFSQLMSSVGNGWVASGLLHCRTELASGPLWSGNSIRTTVKQPVPCLPLCHS